MHYLVYNDAERRLSRETWEEIKKDYADQDIDVSREELLADEASAYYTEAILGGKVTVDMLLGDTSSTASGPPSPAGEGLAKRILSFFTEAARAYSKDAKLSREARRHYKRFKAMFDAFAERNKGRNSATAVASEERRVNSEEVRESAIRFAKMSIDGLSDSVDRVIEMDDEEAIKNKEEGNYISISKRTPDFILEKVEDAEDLELIMRFDSFYLATRHSGALKGHYHNYGDIMKSLPEIISNPLAIVRMDDGRLNILSEVKTAKGNTSIVSVELNTVKDINGKNDKYNLVVTVTPAKDNYVRNNLQNRGIKVEYEKEDLPQVNSQLHEWLTTVNDKSSDTSISQNEDLSTDSAKKVEEKSAKIGKNVKSAESSSVKVGANNESSSENSAEGGKSIRKSKDITPKVADESGIEKSIGKLGEGEIESVAGRDAKAGARRAAAYSRRRADMKVGQLRQMVARYTGEKVYTSKEARETIDNIYGVFTLSAKNRQKLYDALWQGYNSCRTADERQEFSYDMAEYVTVMMLAESSAANPDKAGALETLA